MMTDMNEGKFTRKGFLKTSGAALGGSLITGAAVQTSSGKAPSKPLKRQSGKMRVAVVGLGVRGVGMYGRTLVNNYGDHIEMVGLCDTNPGRLAYGKEYIGVNCPTFNNLDEMLETTRPDRLVVTTWDWEHHNCVVAGLEHGVDVICEKPLTIDEEKLEIIIEADRRYDNDVYVTFNYRYPPLPASQGKGEGAVDERCDRRGEICGFSLEYQPCTSDEVHAAMAW